MPLIAATGGEPDFSELTFTNNNSVFRYGEFINASLTFLVIAAVDFFVRRGSGQHLARAFPARADAGPDDAQVPECLSEIPVEARRCAFCTARVPAA